MNKLIGNLPIADTVVGKSGKTYPLLHSHKQKEGTFVHNLVSADTWVSKTLEIGCAQGLFSLQICSATQGRKGALHTIIDPFQNSLWDGVGIQTLLDAGLRFFEFIEKKSELALPLLLLRDEAQFDFILVNGWHTFDHVVLDCFYATKLLKVGGYLVLDSVSLPSVKRLSALLSTWPCYEEYASVRDSFQTPRSLQILRRISEVWRKNDAGDFVSEFVRRWELSSQKTRMVAFKKAEPDSRTSTWHDDSF